MKKMAILSVAVLLTVLSSAVMADEGGKSGKLLLFQKCDTALINLPGGGYDAFGCPVIGTGPWPVLPDDRRHGSGKLEYSLWGEKFSYSFEGHRLLPKKQYTLIYYPDPWPGSNLICLGNGYANRGGNVAIRGRKDIGTGLPASYDANFNPVGLSGAVGAKIWLVLSDDVQCATVPPAPPAVPQMIGWNPAAYLFEYNLIVYEKRDASSRSHHDDDEDDDD